jgi:hypothetical protein
VVVMGQENDVQVIGSHARIGEGSGPATAAEMTRVSSRKA